MDLLWWIDIVGFFKHLWVWYPKPVSIVLLASVVSLVLLFATGVAMMISNHLFPDD